MFCNENDFTDLDEVYSHQATITANGFSICPKLREWDSVIDSSTTDERIPLKIADKKYAPKNHDGIYITYTSQGHLAKDTTKTGKNYLHYHLLHGLPPILKHSEYE